MNHPAFATWDRGADLYVPCEFQLIHPFSSLYRPLTPLPMPLVSSMAMRSSDPAIGYQCVSLPYDCTPWASCFMFAMHCAFRADSVPPMKFTTSAPMRAMMMAITTINSTSVKPLFIFMYILPFFAYDFVVMLLLNYTSPMVNGKLHNSTIT